MGGSELKCPLCCNETFNSHSELKYHILSIVDNCFCSICNVRCLSIVDLAEHIGRKCIDPPPPMIEENVTHFEFVDAKAAYSLNNHLSVNNSILEKALLSAKDNEDIKHMENDLNHKPKSDVKKVVSQETNSVPAMSNIKIEFEESEGTSENANNMELEDDTIYNCEMCNMNFMSIEEHLQQYHEGEEVVLEEVDHTNEENPADKDIREYNSDTEENTESFAELEPNDDMEETIARKIEEAKERETIEEQDCLDKDGRVYTRKVVKIDKFWMKEDEERQSEPTVEKYLFENGKIKKITEEEALNVPNKSQIIEVYQCQNCFAQFPNPQNCRNHNCKPVKNAKKFKCEFCSTVFLTKHSLVTHLECHKNEKNKTVTLTPYYCDQCNTMFPSFKSLRLHKRMHDPIKAVEPEAPVKYSMTGPMDDDIPVRTLFQCKICDKKYDEEYEQIHMKSHENIENFDCAVCNRKFFTLENLDMHMKVHTLSKKIKCSYCKKPFSNAEALEDHVANQCNKRQYACSYCGRRFARPHEKVKHERIHTGEKPHVCQICGKTFRVSYCLTLHLRTHSGTRPYQCAHCEKRFKSHSVYNHHLMTHSDVRAYKCPFCPKAFKTSVQLAGHKNSHIKPFNCTECTRPFASLYAVRAHMETHKRENNLKYDCFLCGASYARSFALRDHLKSQHNNSENTFVSEDDRMLLELETAVSTHQIESEMQVEMEESEAT